MHGWPQGNFSKAGGVKLVMDRLIGHQVFSLSGAVPAANYLQLPQDKSESLALTGRFLYLQVLLQPGETYSIHVDVKTGDKNTTRISISNLFSPESAKQSHIVIQVPYATPNEKWTMLALDLAALLAPVTKAVFEEVKRVQFCANMAVRGAFTADFAYTWKDLPKELVLSHAVVSSDFHWSWFPLEPQPTAKAISKVQVPLREVSNIDTPQSSASLDAKPQKVMPGPRLTASTKPAQDMILPQSPATEDAWLQMHHVNGFTGEFTKVMTWLPDSPDLIFAAGNIITIMNSQTGVQRHLLGCANNICALACSADGQLIVSGEAGKPGLIRLWEAASGKCLALLHGHLGGVICLDLSPAGRHLVAVGLNSHSKQLIILWNISTLLAGDQAQVLAKHISDYNIKAVKFSPYEEGRLMTCGKDSVRMYRLKLGHLRGMSVQVAPAPGEMSRGSWLDTNVFTDIAFETDCGLSGLEERHVYVTSISGAVYQINYGRRILERVYQLHSAAINCMLVSVGLCVTASDDKFLRVWPLDFSDYLLEAEHEAPVTAIGLAPDGLTIAVGTENGAIGCLDVPTHQYRTLLRSHTDTINAVAVDAYRGEYCTVSLDGTIRGWDVQSHQQLFELAAPGEVIQCCAYHPDRHELACGFGEGRVRIFNLDDTTLLQEHKQHRSTVLQVLYLPSGKLLFSMGQDGNLCVYEVAQTYLPIKYLSTTTQQQPGCMAVSPDSALLATISYSGTGPLASILLFDGQTLDAVRRIQSNATGFTCLAFSPDGAQLVTTTADRSLANFSISTGQLLQESSKVHKVGIDSVAVSPNASLIATGGADRTIQLYPYLAQADGMQQQSFVGHSDSVTGLAWADDQTLISTGAGDAVIIWHRTSAPLPSTPDPTATHPHATPTPTLGRETHAEAVLQGQPIHNTLVAWNEPATTATDLGQSPQPLASPCNVGAVSAVTYSLPVQQVAASAAAMPPGVDVQQTAASIVGTSSQDRLQQHAACLTMTNAVQLDTGPMSLAVAEQAMGASATACSTAVALAHSPLSHSWHQCQSVGGSPAVNSLRGLTIERVVGFNGAAPGGCVWLESSAQLVYAAGRMLLIEDLATRQQRHSLQCCLKPCRNKRMLQAFIAVLPEAMQRQMYDACRRLVQHAETINTCAASEDGAVVASACPAPAGALGSALGAQICLWDVATATCLHVIHHHKHAVQMLSFSPDGMWLLSAGQDPDQSVAIWDVATAALLTSGHTPQPVRAAAWRHGTALPSFVTISKSEVLAWDLEPSHLAQRTLRVPQEALGAPLTALACHGNGSVFVADEQGNVWQLQIASGSNLVTCLKCCSLPSTAGPAGISCVQVQGANLTVATVSGQIVRLVPQQASSSIWVEQHHMSLASDITTLYCQISGSHCIACTASGNLWYVDLETGSQMPLVTGHAVPITSLALPVMEVSMLEPNLAALDPAQAPAVQMMATTAEDGVLRIWQLPTEQSDWHQVCALMDFQSQQACTAAAMVATGTSHCCAAGYEGGCLRLFDLATASLVWSSEGAGQADCIMALEPSHDGKQLLAVARNGDVSLHSISKGGLLAEWQHNDGNTHHVAAIAFSAGKKELCALASARGCTVCAVPWLRATGAVTSQYNCPEGPVLASQLSPEQSQTAAISFGPDGSNVVYSSPMLQDKLLVYDYQRGMAVRYISMQQPMSVLCGPLSDDSIAFADASGTVGTLDIKTNRSSLVQGCQIRCKAMSKCGDRHLVLSDGSNMLVYNIISS